MPGVSCLVAWVCSCLGVPQLQSSPQSLVEKMSQTINGILPRQIVKTEERLSGAPNSIWSQLNSIIGMVVCDVAKAWNM